ncbi:hypothetical protein GOBAR_AA31561 [Gossypium barbadense]|uniref:Uncharacterized protein n=1 Tax=Gossypium barbadense TaxID=3634 RepID=A0A2P5WDE1_GOSBA|nr:hypothetical protein GOBAR_AA31561 [Gossypium barbadense]
MPVCQGTTPVYCCPRLHGTGVSYGFVEEIESSLAPGMPVFFHSHARVHLSNSPMAMSHGRGDLSHPMFWGNHLPCFRMAVTRSRVSLRVDHTTLSTTVWSWEPMLQIPSLFTSPMPVCQGTTPVYCCPRLHGTGVSYGFVEEIESSLAPGMPVFFHSHARVHLSNSPMAMSHGRGDLSHPMFWGNHLPCFRMAVTRSRVSLRVDHTTLSTTVWSWEPMLQIPC